MPGTRLFFIACLFIGAGLTAILIGALWPNEDLPDTVVSGHAIWTRLGCEGCHTLYGLGGDYAPDLTHIVESRGADYIREFLVNPNAFHPSDRRMPRFNISVSETSDIIDFLAWIGQSPAGLIFPPRVINVAGGGGLASSNQGADSSDASSTLVAGKEIYSRRCATCHSIEPEIVNLGPSLAGIADRAWHRVQGQSAEQYIRNSILYPADFVVPGFADVMQKNFAELLTSQDLDNLITFLMTLKEPA